LTAPRFVDDATVTRLLEPIALVDTMAQTLIAYSAGQMVNPLRIACEVPAGAAAGGMLFVKPVITPDTIVTKVITQMPGNAARGLPTLLATLMVMERATGRLLGVLEATALTNLRTAAMSAVAVRTFAPARPLVVAMIGSGALARTHALCVRAVREVAELRIWSPTEAKRAACAVEVGGVACASAQAACVGADVVITATLASAPVVRGAWLKPGAVVCAVGAPRPTWRELDDDVMHAGLVIADSRESAESESGDVKLSGARVFAELGEVLAGKHVVPAGTTVVFKSLGLAAEDAAAAAMVLARV
jgi:ornithine cyclodeaminase